MQALFNSKKDSVLICLRKSLPLVAKTNGTLHLQMFGPSPRSASDIVLIVYSCKDTARVPFLDCGTIVCY